MCPPPRLSVNINKVATLRNARGGDLPNVLRVALDCERFGAQGITVHPRPDERHIRYADVRELRPLLSTEFNIEGNPNEPKFVDLVLEVKPDQVTLVPDATNQRTSDHGWDTVTHRDLLQRMIGTFKIRGIRTSIFVDPDPAMVEGALAVGTDRIELYTEAYARGFASDRVQAIASYVAAARQARELGIGLNAGHDLNLDNLAYFVAHIEGLLEVSIGHALIADALYHGLEQTIQLYRQQLEPQTGPRLIPTPTRIEAAGNLPKVIEEFVGRVNSGTHGVSVARMRSPAGWVEPGQTPRFDEYTLVLNGTLRVTHRDGMFDVRAGQAVLAPRGTWVQYSSPDQAGAEYVAVCLPAFSPDTVHRDSG